MKLKVITRNNETWDGVIAEYIKNYPTISMRTIEEQT